MERRRLLILGGIAFFAIVNYGVPINLVFGPMFVVGLICLGCGVWRARQRAVRGELAHFFPNSSPKKMAARLLVYKPPCATSLPPRAARWTPHLIGTAILASPWTQAERERQRELERAKLPTYSVEPLPSVLLFEVHCVRNGIRV